jgi:hypothetical protein
LSVPRICGSVTGDLEGGFVVIVVEAFGDDFVTFIVEVRNTVTLHRTGVSTIFTDRDNLDTGFGNFYDHIEVNVGLIVTPAGIKDIIDFDGVGLGNLLKVIFGGDDDVEAVVFVAAVDVTLTVDFVDGES